MTMSKPTASQLLVDINHHLKLHFAGDEVKILDWLRTCNPLLQDLAPVELVALGKSEHLLAFIRNMLPLPAVQEPEELLNK